MSPLELSGYENEPEETFTPLPADLYCTFFDLEMSVQSYDCRYYEKILAQSGCRNLLELGCGTGRIIGHLADKGYRTVGIDNSLAMLSHQRDRHVSPVALMDMRQLGFQKHTFDSVIIAHNTLNLLGETKAIRRCLSEVCDILTRDGLLLLQIFAVTEKLQKMADKRLFQFELFDTFNNGKLVKETIKLYQPDSNNLVLEERYKLRSFDNPAANRNYRQFFSLAAFPPRHWFKLIYDSGFSVCSTHADYTGDPFISGNDPTLLVIARPL